MINLSLGISSCPNDTFIFHALLHGLVRPESAEDMAFSLHIADVEELNELALEGQLLISKVSLGVIPHILDKYAILSSGAALGFGCGPLVAAASKDVDPENARVASPGEMTTANLLLNLHGGFKGERKQMIFSDVMPAVVSGHADMGVIIHEGRFTFERHGLHKILDLGEWWENKFVAPLPLGAIVIRRDAPRSLALALEKAIAQSVEYAQAHPGASWNFVSMNARELSREVIESHIDTFVTDFSKDLGAEGRSAVRRLLEAAPGKRSHEREEDIFLS